VEVEQCRNVGLTQDDGETVDIGTGEDFACCAVEDSQGMEELEGVENVESVKGFATLALRIILTCDRSAARQTAGVILVVTAGDLNWNV